MRKFALALATVIGMTSVAHADWNGHRHGGYGGGYGHQQYRGGGGDAGVAIIGGLLGGMIIGGMIANSQPSYGYGRPVYRQQVCERVPDGYFWNGYQWVPAWQTVCY